MLEQLSYPHLPYPDRLTAAWVDAASAGVSPERFVEVVEDAARAAKYEPLSCRTRQIRAAGAAEAARLGYTTFEYVGLLHAVRMIGCVGDAVVFRVVQLGDQTDDDIEIASFTVKGVHDPLTVQAMARAEVEHVHTEATPLQPTSGYAVFKHDDGHIYEIHRIGSTGRGFRCTVVQLGPRGAEKQVAAFDVTPPSSRKSTVALATAEITRVNLAASRTLPAVSGDAAAPAVPEPTDQN
jgi:hypothetical protein